MKALCKNYIGTTISSFADSKWNQLVAPHTFEDAPGQLHGN